VSCTCRRIDRAVKGHHLLEETVSWVNAGASSWSAPNDTSSSLLEELVVIMCSWHAVDFVLRIYTNLMYNYIIKFDFFKKNNSAAPPLYRRLPKMFKPANIQNICHKPVDFIFFLPEILDYSISSHFQRDNIMFLIIKWRKKS